MSSTEARRLFRKHNKRVQIIAKTIGVEESKSATEWLFVWGLGLALGSVKKDIKNILGPDVEKVYLYKDQSFCALEFGSATDAERSLINFKAKDFDPAVHSIGFLFSKPPSEDLEVISAFSNPWPDGLRVIENFVSESEEEGFLFDLLPQCKDDSNLRQRRVSHFGYEFCYGDNTVDPDVPMDNGIPVCLQKLLERIHDELKCGRIQQLTVNQYGPGQGIPPHIDTHSCFESPIISLSLSGSTVMDFKLDDQKVSVLVPQRSLLVMGDSSRYQWTHGIPSRTFDIVPDQIHGGITALVRKPRVSLTFRILRKSKVCQCRFPKQCDSQEAKLCSRNADEVESELVHKVYEAIAPHFSETRHTPWPNVKNFVQNLPSGAFLLDVGCGNGKYFNIHEDIVQIGLDMSKQLLQICKRKKCDVVRGNILKLPFSSNCFDAVICIAVIHHLSTDERRREALEEIVRVLKPGGTSLVYVWSKLQNLEGKNSAWAETKIAKMSKTTTNNSNKSLKDVNTPSKFSFLPVYDKEVEFQQTDLLVPWTQSNFSSASVHHRYYHVFKKEELESLLIGLSIDISRSYYDQGNWVVEFKKRP